MKQSKVYFRLFLSYIGVLLIPLMLGIAVYTEAVDLARNQAERMNANLLETLQQHLDQKMEELNRVASRLTMDTKVQKAAWIKGEIKAEEQMILYDIYEDLNNLGASENFIDDVFIYFKNTRMVSSIQGNMSADLYYQLYYSKSDDTLEEFEDYMGSVHYADSRKIAMDGGEDILLFTMSDLNTDITEASATIGIVIKVSEIERILDSAKWDEEIQMFLIDENDAIISNRSDYEPGAWEYDNLRTGSYTDTENKKPETLISVRPSKNMDWKYVMIVPLAVLERDMRGVQQLAIAGFLVCLVVGFAVSYYSTKKNYNPIRSLMEMFKGHSNDEIGKGENEYQWLIGQMKRFFNEQVDTERILSHNKKNLRQYYLSQLLQYFYDGDKETLHQYGINLDQQYNLVLLFLIRDVRSGEQGIETDHQEDALRKFILMNILEELLLNYFDVDLVEMGERVAVIVHAEAAGSEEISLVREKVEGVQQMIEDQFGFRADVLIGSFEEGLDGLHTSFLKAQELEDYLQLLDTDLVVFDEVKDIQPQYNYSLEAEQRIINAVKVGDAAKAKEYLHMVFENNFRGKVSNSVCRCLIYDMIGTLLKGANAGGYPQAAKEIEFNKGFEVKTPRAALEKRFCDVVEQICQKIHNGQREVYGDRLLSRSVEEYIQQQYADPDLNISIASQYFKITPTYLSAVYKKQTGGSLLDYINTVRIDKAEELLKNGSSVVEAAQMTGFRDSGSFIRVFKRKRGITPGQMKKATQIQ